MHAYGQTAEQVVTPDTDGQRWSPPIEDVLDPVFSRMGVPPMIVVIPDGTSRYGCGLGRPDRRRRRQSPVCASPVFRRQFLIERGCQERMREADHLGCLLDHACGKGRLERVVGDARGMEQGRRRTANRRDEEQRLPRRFGKITQPPADEAVEALG